MGEPAAGPLSGVRVLELGNFIAGPFAGQLLADYGAEVIKIEDPAHGDPMRKWGVTVNGESLWWSAIARNKRSVAIDLRDSRGRDAVRTISSKADLIVENFRPGRLESWKLDYGHLSSENPRLVMVRVSGFGQTGPRAEQAGFGSIGEAFGGIRATTGFPDRMPTRTGISLGDSLASLFAVIGGIAGVFAARSTGKGQVVDVAIYEAVAALMESTMADYEIGGVMRTRSGSVLPGVSPSNVYRTRDGTPVLIAANADGVFARLCAAMKRPDLSSSEEFSTHTARAANMARLDEIIDNWSSKLSSTEVLDLLATHSVPAGPIVTAKDMLEDEHYQARGMVARVINNAGTVVPMSGLVPKFSETPGTIRHAGPRLGADTESVLTELASLSRDEIAALRSDLVIRT
jgi:crotonobetainyl-CoA:carnitine CoA-transferase CaiB-like acyl-CoA transferase